MRIEPGTLCTPRGCSTLELRPFHPRGTFSVASNRPCSLQPLDHYKLSSRSQRSPVITPFHRRCRAKVANNQKSQECPPFTETSSFERRPACRPLTCQHLLWLWSRLLLAGGGLLSVCLKRWLLGWFGGGLDGWIRSLHKKTATSEMPVSPLIFEELAGKESTENGQLGLNLLILQGGALRLCGSAAYKATLHHIQAVRTGESASLDPKAALVRACLGAETVERRRHFPIVGTSGSNSSFLLPLSPLFTICRLERRRRAGVAPHPRISKQSTPSPFSGKLPTASPPGWKSTLCSKAMASQPAPVGWAGTGRDGTGRVAACPHLPSFSGK